MGCFQIDSEAWLRVTLMRTEAVRSQVNSGGQSRLLKPTVRYSADSRSTSRPSGFQVADFPAASVDTRLAMTEETRRSMPSQANFLDKTVWALTKLDEISRPVIYLTKLFIACALGMNLFIFYGLLLRKEIINPLGLGQIPAPLWAVLILLFGLCYIPVHLATHSAAEIKELQLSWGERWAYTILGLFIAGSWGITGILFL